LNRYIDLKRIEFIITYACTGRCKHCSNGDQSGVCERTDADAAAISIKRLTERFELKSIMTFGGEPLLEADTVCKIHATAYDCGVSKRQIITNGYFSRDKKKIDEVAKALCESCANDILLSVDVFHQEYIPIEPVMQFAEALLRYGVPSLRVQPAWVVNEGHENLYNTETRLLLKLFADKGIEANKGNDIFPSGNALKYLAEYFDLPEKVDLTIPCGYAPYTTPLDAVDCFSIKPNGDVSVCSITIGNIYKSDILDIVDNYDPNNNPASRAVLKGGVSELLNYAETQGINLDINDCRSACGVCRKAMAAISSKMRIDEKIKAKGSTP